MTYAPPDFCDVQTVISERLFMHHIIHPIHTVNMTTGSPAKQMLKLAVPLMLTSIGQQAYGICDAIIVGRGVGVNAFAALGVSSWLVWLVLWSVQGLTQGFSSLIARNFGAGKENDIRRALGMCIKLCIIIGVIITIVFVLFTKPLLILINTPADIMEDAALYITIIYAGTLITVAYNMAAAILRAVGDGKTPLQAMGIAGITNVVLNYIFVINAGCGIGGAAVATLIAQVFAFLFCFEEIRNTEIFKLSDEDKRWHNDTAKELLNLGVPLALASTIGVVGGMLAQSVVNTYGSVFVAGCTAAIKFHGVVECSAIAIGFASASFIGQNYGAKKMERVHRGIKSALIIAILTAVAAMIIMLFLEKPIVGLFLDSRIENADEALHIAYEYVAVMNAMLIGAFLMNLYKYSIQGLGNTIIPMLAGFLEIGAKMFTLLVFPLFIGNMGVFLMDGMAWCVSAVFQMIFFYKLLRKTDRAVLEVS